MKIPKTMRQHWVYMIFGQRRKEEKGYYISQVRIGDLQVVEEEQNTHGRKILAGQLRNSGTQRGLFRLTCLGVFPSNARL